MMAKLTMAHLTDVIKAASDVIKASEAVREGIATHAEKHEVALLERRKRADLAAREAEGVRRHGQTL